MLNLIQEAAELLGHLTGWPIEVRHINSAPCQPDGLMTIVRDGQKYEFAVETRKQITAPMLPRIVEQLRTHEKSMMLGGLLVVPYIPPSQTEALRKTGISYIDLKGNIFLNVPGLTLWFVGAARGVKDVLQLPTAIQRETLTGAGVRLVYGLLSDPKRVDEPYRVLAQRAGVAVGSVKATLDWLQRRGFLRIFGQRPRADRGLVKKRELLERWTEAYGERLRPKLQIGRYTPRGRTVSLPMMQRNALYPGQASWGGEMAAVALLGEQHYKPGMLTLYLHHQQELNLLLAQNKLGRDSNGEMEILTAFWPPDDETKTGIAPPLVVYADLMNAASSRCWEAGREIYQRFLKERIEHDS